MPRFEHDPSEVSAVISVFPKEEYEFLVGEPSAFYNAGKEGKQDNYGVRYKMTVAEDKGSVKKNEFSFYNCFEHTEGSRGFGKQYRMAVLGFPVTKQGEAAFDAKYKGSDWSIDTDSKACGDAWRDLTGKRVRAVVDVGINTTTGEPQQKWVRFLPL
jgi:hypothetical protein